MPQDLEDPVDLLPDPGLDPEALIEEVRRQTRRRRRRNLAVVLVILLGGLALVLGAQKSRWAAGGAGSPNGGARTPGRYFKSSYLREPISLAPAPDGGLYIGDAGRQQIVELLANRSVKVIAGSGRGGLSGDGGPAVRADMDAPNSLVRTRGGALAFTQVGVIRGSLRTAIRIVTPSGVIHTLAGLRPRCNTRARVIKSLPALSAKLTGGGLSIGPTHALDMFAYACPGFGPYLKLTPAGLLVRTRLDATLPNWIKQNCGAPASGPGFIAFECDSGSGHPKELLVRRGNGTMDDYPRFGGGALTSAAGEAVAGYNGTVVRVTAKGLRTILSNLQTTRLAPGSLPGLTTNALALNSRGDLFIAGDVYLDHAAGCEALIIEVPQNGRPRKLWNRKSRLCY